MRLAAAGAAAPGRKPKTLGRLGDAPKYLRIKMIANLSPAELSCVACVSRAFHPTDGSKGLVEAACAELVGWGSTPLGPPRAAPTGARRALPPASE